MLMCICAPQSTINANANSVSHQIHNVKIKFPDTKQHALKRVVYFSEDGIVEISVNCNA